MRVLQVVGLLGFAVCLAACGGGGSTAPEVTLPSDVRSDYSAMFEIASMGVSTPDADATFDGDFLVTAMNGDTIVGEVALSFSASESDIDAVFTPGVYRGAGSDSEEPMTGEFSANAMGVTDGFYGGDLSGNYGFEREGLPKDFSVEGSLEGALAGASGTLGFGDISGTIIIGGLPIVMRDMDLIYVGHPTN